MLLTNNNYKQFIRNASIFTTGGGIPVPYQYRYLYRKKIHAQLRQIKDFAENAYICVVAELGPTSSKPLNKKNQLQKMIHILETLTGKHVDGIYAPEFGQECVALDIATVTHLPIADFSPAGMRAVPYVDMHVFSILHKQFSYAPMVVLTDQGDLIVIPEKLSDKRLEQILRHLTRLSSNASLFVMGGVVSVKELSCLTKEYLAPFYQVLDFPTKTVLPDLLKKLHPKRTVQGVVGTVTEYEVNGFFAEKVSITSLTGEQFSLIVMNEALFVLDATGYILASMPEKILLVHPKELRGLSGVELHQGQEVVIAVVAEEKLLQARNVEKIFGAQRFRFLLEK